MKSWRVEEMKRWRDEDAEKEAKNNLIKANQAFAIPTETWKTKALKKNTNFKKSSEAMSFRSSSMKVEAGRYQKQNQVETRNLSDEMSEKNRYCVLT